MPTCCAPGCRSGYGSSRNDEKRHFFTAPKDAACLKVRQNAIPRKKFTLTSKNYVCDLHFQPDDIDCYYSHVINGQTVLMPRGQWSLKRDAVPRQFPNVPAHLSKPSTKSRKQKLPTDRSVVQSAASCATCDVIIADETEADDDSNRTNSHSDVSDICSGISGTQSPVDGWSLQRTPEGHTIFYKLAEKQGVVSVMRAVTLRKDLPVVVSVGGKPVPEASYRSRSMTNQQPWLATLEELKLFLGYVDFLKVCSGCPCDRFPTVTTSITAVRDGDVWRRKTCLVLSERATCRECLLTQKVLCEREKRNSLKQTSSQRKPRLRVKNLQRKVIRATAFREKARREMANLKRQLSEMSDEKIEAAISVLPCSEQLAFRTESGVSKIRTGKAV
ncbi:unnamed protein product [Ixodes hexagonus]